MVSIVGVGVGIQGTGDDEQRYRFTSDRGFPRSSPKYPNVRSAQHLRR